MRLKEEDTSFSKIDAAAFKGIAVCFLLLHHLFNAEAFQNHEITSDFLSAESILNFGVFSKVCLAMFVFMSGYGISKSIELNKNNIANKTKQRFIKLFMDYTFLFIIINIFSIVIPIGEHNFIDLYWSHGIIYGLIYFISDWLCLSNFLGLPTMNVTWWWMPVALLITFITPMLYNWVKKYGGFSFIFAVLLPYIIGLNLGTSLYLFPSLILGMYSSIYNVFDNIIAGLKHKTVYSICLVILDISFMILIYMFRTRIGGFVAIYDSAFAFSICLFIILFIKKMQSLQYILQQIGKNSLYIFLIHTFIFHYWFSEYVYKMKNWFLIFIVLLCLSFIASNIIKTLKKFSAYDKLITKIIWLSQNKDETKENLYEKSI